ncbi:peroxiredoxin [Dyadobacter sp. CY343]|uniref:peroxiredoxin family protein n=1 Tax=Dyadobacter sp. CY343 TaxID=2907299 RepID=UPI001F349E6E|nr:TlpA disulfide reductase family protein [Dyadobacter sp. CY343]MCE7061961.1 TlpA family protein disulfide reductase [Dyadobacter sp. CY343]
MMQIDREMERAYQKFLEENPDNLIAIEAIDYILGPRPDIDLAEKLFRNLTSSVQNSPMGLHFAARLSNLRNVKIGSLAPDFSQLDTAGKKVSLSDFRGKYILIDFWASWCGPCRAEHPRLKKEFEKYKERDFSIIGISLDKKSERDAWIRAIQKDKLVWSQLSDLQGWSNQVARMYDIHAIPANFLIDPNGIVIAKDLRGNLLSDKLAEIFGASR